MSKYPDETQNNIGTFIRSHANLYLYYKLSVKCPTVLSIQHIIRRVAEKVMLHILLSPFQNKDSNVKTDR